MLWHPTHESELHGLNILKTAAHQLNGNGRVVVLRCLFSPVTASCGRLSMRHGNRGLRGRWGRHECG